MVNPLGTKGNLAQAFANILRDMWQGELQCLNPVTFRVCRLFSQCVVIARSDCFSCTAVDMSVCFAVRWNRAA